MKIKFRQYDCDLKVEVYSENLQCCLKLVNYEGPVAVATVNLHAPIALNEVFIKNWSENKGILEALIEAGVIEDTGEVFPTGHTFAHVCKLVGEVKEEYLKKRKAMKFFNFPSNYGIGARKR